PKVILYLTVLFSIPAILLNIGADIEGMGAVAHLIYPRVNTLIYCVVITILLILLIIFLPYKKIVAVLKYLCISILLYLIVPFFTNPDWLLVVKNTFIPTIHLDKEFIGMLVALLGTTISPYLFFWQATMEAHDVRLVEKSIIVNKNALVNNLYDPRERRL